MHSLIARLDALARQEADLFPEMKGGAGALGAELALLQRLGLVSPKIRIDTENLVQTLEQALPFREMRRPNSHIDEAAAQAAALCSDLLVRSGNLVDQHAAAVAMGAAVARNGDEIPETASVPAVHVTPPAARPVLVDDSPIMIEEKDLSFLVQDVWFGRVSGEALAVQLERSSSAAPWDAVVLSEGELLRFGQGESFILEIHGMILGDRTVVPKETASASLLCEAGEDGVTLYGPAVARFPGLPSGMLSRTTSILDRFIAQSCQIKSFRGDCTVQEALAQGRCERENVEFLLDHVPPEILDGRLHVDLRAMRGECAFTKTHSDLLKIESKDLWSVLIKYVDFAMATQVINGMNFLPEKKILVQRGYDIRFADVPKALPAPRRDQITTARKDA